MEKGELDEKADSFTAFKVQICFLCFFIFLDFCLSSHCFRTLGMLCRRVARKHTVLLDLATISGQNRKMLTCVRQCCSNVPMLVLFKTVVQCTLTLIPHTSTSKKHQKENQQHLTTFKNLI